MSNFLNLLEQYSLSSLLQPLAFTILAFILLFKWLSTASSTKKNLPPSPPKLPVIGNLHQISIHPHRSLHALAQHHGSFMLLRLGSVPVLVVSSADAACHIMKTHDLIFADRPKSRYIEKLLYNYRDVSMAPYGEYWRKMKSIFVLHLLSNKMVQSFRTMREEEIALMIENIEHSCSSSSSSPVNLSQTLARLTNDVVCRVALGRKYSGGEGGRQFKELLGSLTELLGGFNVGDYIPWLAWVNQINGKDAKAEKVAKELDTFLDGVVEEHIENQNKGNDSHVSVECGKHTDFVDILLWIQRQNVVGFPIDRVSIKALILDAFAAGTDTTYTVLEWAMTELLRHLNVMKKVQNEVRGVRSDKKQGIKEEDLNKMHYLKAVIKETLRLHPPVPLLVPRESTQDVRIKGYDIAARTQVVINVWAIGRDPVSWEQAEKFWPERFLNTPIDFKGHDFQFTPFGAGRRACPGILFAMIVIELGLANLLHKFNWEVVGRERGEDLDVTESTGVTIHKKFPLVAVATPESF